MSTEISSSPAAKALQIYEQRTGFKPKKDREFYNRLGIAPKRFSMLLQGRLDITWKEVLRVSEVFNVQLNDLQ